MTKKPWFDVPCNSADMNNFDLSASSLERDVITLANNSSNTLKKGKLRRLTALAGSLFRNLMNDSTLDENGNVNVSKAIVVRSRREKIGVSTYLSIIFKNNSSKPIPRTDYYYEVRETRFLRGTVTLSRQTGTVGPLSPKEAEEKTNLEIINPGYFKRRSVYLKVSGKDYHFE